MTFETTKGERFTYVLFFIGQNMIYMLSQMMLFIFYVSHLRIDPAVVATIMLLTRTFDAVNDPAIGFLMDRFRLTKSKYKTYINFAAIMLPISTFLVFLVPSGLSQGLTIFLVVITYLVFDVMYTISDVPIFAISTVMTSSEEERTKLLALGRVGALGAVLALPVIGIFQQNGNDNINWLLMAGILVILSMVTMIPQRFFLQERHNVEIEKKEKLTLKQIIGAVLKNDQLLLIMFLYLSQTFINAQMGYGAYVAEGYYGEASLNSVSSLLMMVFLLPLALLATKIVGKFGKNKFMYFGGLMAVLGGAIVFFLPAGIGWLAVLPLAFASIGSVVPSLLRGMYTADCIEYGQNKTGIRAEASSFSIQTFFNKLADALGLALAGWVMAWAGFDETIGIQGNSTGVFEKLHLSSAIFPALMGLIYIVGIFFFYKLDEKKVEGLIEANEQKESSKCIDKGVA